MSSFFIAAAARAQEAGRGETEEDAADNRWLREAETHTE